LAKAGPAGIRGKAVEIALRSYDEIVITSFAALKSFLLIDKAILALPHVTALSSL
jgi:hypothetical protein